MQHGQADKNLVNRKREAVVVMVVGREAPKLVDSKGRENTKEREIRASASCETRIEQRTTTE